MKCRMFTMAAAVMAAAILLSVCAYAEPSVSAKSAVVMDADSGRILWQKNADTRSLIASTTKIMTGYIIAQECDPDAMVEIQKEAAGIEGSSVYLKAGEIRSVRELLYGMMLHSGNDAAAALAIFCGGSMEGFASKMNDYVRKIGLQDTNFANAHGLDSDDNYSTARDLAKLTAYAMRNALFREVVSTKSISFPAATYTNHNKLLWKYEGTIGVKTGYTKAAGRILVSCAERNGSRLIAVTINAPDDWNDHINLLDHGFEAYEKQTILNKARVRILVPVIGGGEKYAAAVLREDVCFPVMRGEEISVSYCISRFEYPPLISGQVAGWAQVTIGEELMEKVPLYWQYSVLEGA